MSVRLPSPEEQESMRYLHSKGWRLSALARHYHLPPVIVWRAVKGLLDPRRKPAPKPVKPRKVLTPEERAEALRLRPSLTIKQLARKCGVSLGQINRLLAKGGKEEKHRPGAGPEAGPDGSVNPIPSTDPALE
jgi:hypothetical protein